MTRLPEITDRQDLPPDKQHIFDAIIESRGRIHLPFSLLLHSPHVAGYLEPLTKYVRYESSLTPALRELATITTSRELDCDYMWPTHSKYARDLGVPETTINLVGNRGPLDSLADDEALVIRYGRELLHDHRVSDTTFHAARARFGDRGVTDLTAHFGAYAFTACVLNAFEKAPSPNEARLPLRSECDG